MLEFELLQVAIGKRKCLSHQPTDKEWEELYQFAEKHALVGILFGGGEKTLSISPLKGESKTGPDAWGLSMDLLMEWLGQTEYIKTQNDVVNKRAAEITEMFAKDGMRTCVLKGQANAVNYPKPELRTSGDIDLWVEGDRDAVAKYVIEHEQDYTRMQFHHIDYHVFQDVEVEVHFYPMMLFNYMKNKTLQEVFSKYADICFKNWMPDGKRFCRLTALPDALMQLVHMYRHLFDGGIGLRQMLDFYYLLERAKLGSSTELKEYLRDTGLMAFAGAVCYVLQTVFLADNEILIAPVDERRGKFLLNEIMEGGNFGQHDTRYKQVIGSQWHNFWYMTYKNLRLLTQYSSDCVWNIIYRIAQFVWRKRKGYK